MHHDHDKRIAVLEIEVKMNRETINNSITELVDRQATHEEKFERMLERMTAALVGIELKMEKYMVAAQSSSSTWEKVWKYGTPILIAAIGAAWMLHKNG
jgi:hypothetical protein